MLGPEELGESRSRVEFERRLANYLHAHAGEHDVVDCDADVLPVDRRLIPAHVFVVARVQLLLRRYVDARAQRLPFDRRIGWWLRYRKELEHLRSRIPRQDASLRAADAVITLNSADRSLLRANGISNVHVLPNGIGVHHREALMQTPVAPPDAPRVAYIGTWGPRKGLLDYPRVVARIAEALPETTFTLLGVGPQWTEKGVRRFFPAGVRHRVDVVPVYDPEDLPGALASCSIGLFPSYAEAFGLGVVEMLAAALPVYAYDVPGPADILDQEFLVPAGDVEKLSRRAIELMADTDRLARERSQARERAKAFDWDEIAVETKRLYESKVTLD